MFSFRVRPAALLFQVGICGNSVASSFGRHGLGQRGRVFTARGKAVESICFVEGGDTADGDQQVFRQGSLGDHSGGRVGGEKLCEEAVEVGEVGEVGDRDGSVGDEIEAAAAGAKHGVEVWMA